MKRFHKSCMVSFLGFIFILIQAFAYPTVACNISAETRLGTLEQCRWYRYDQKTDTVRFCMRLKRLKLSIDPVYVLPFLKSGDFAHVIHVLPPQPVSLAVGECKTLCWQFSKPDDLDLNRFYEYTDIEDRGGHLIDYIWRTDRITGFASGNLTKSSLLQTETLAWPMFNEGTKRMTSPMQVTTSADMSAALPDWEVVDITPALDSPFWLQPGETPLGTITIQRPDNSSEGLSTIRPRLINTETGEIVQEVNIRLTVDHTMPELLEASAQREGDDYLFRITALDVHSGVADAVQLHMSINGKPFESFFLESFDIPQGQGPFVLDTPCVGALTPTTFTIRLGPFKPTDRFQYFFTIPDEAGNTIQTPAVMIHQ